MPLRIAHGVVIAGLLAGCASTPPAAPARAGLDPAKARAAVLVIRQAGAALPTELDVQPVRDPQVTDLQAQAEAAERAGRVGDAVVALDRAIALAPADPWLLQLRAEAALLLGDARVAGDFAGRAHASGPQVGPLCRRTLETLAQVAMHAPGADSPQALRARRDACTVTPPPRY
ncbi:hypothetical protein [Lysobacter humi (ex Lee et al. 2017)]